MFSISKIIDFEIEINLISKNISSLLILSLKYLVIYSINKIFIYYHMHNSFIDYNFVEINLLHLTRTFSKNEYCNISR